MKAEDGLGCAVPGYSPFSVARFFIEKSALNPCADLTPMKLIKLTYICHGWHLALLDSPLIFEPVQAWKYGPVVESLYRAFKHNGNAEIPKESAKNLLDFPSDIKNGTKEIMQAVWEKYSPLTAIYLSSLTHQPGTPWERVWNNEGGNSRNGAIIPDEKIKEFYKQKVQTPTVDGH